MNANIRSLRTRVTKMGTIKIYTTNIKVRVFLPAFVVLLVPWMSFFLLFLLLFFVIGQLKFLALPLITLWAMGYHYNLAQLIFAAGR